MDKEAAPQELVEWLAWYQAAGVDAALDDVPVDWLNRGDVPPGRGFQLPAARASVEQNSGTAQSPAPARRAPPTTAPAGRAPAPSQPSPLQQAPLQQAPLQQATLQSSAATTPARPLTPLAPSSGETEARRVARAAASLDQLQRALNEFGGCSLRATATNLCFYRGAPHADVMIVGEAPGRDEDLAGKPFVGRAGQLLDRMLSAIGLDEGRIHITNVVYWRPPGNRTPTPQETLVCRPFLERQLELVAPKLVVALGGAAAKEVLGQTEGIMRQRGRWREIDIAGRKVPAIATLHPAYLLRTPAAKQLAWIDLIQIAERLDAL